MRREIAIIGVVAALAAPLAVAEPPADAPAGTAAPAAAGSAAPPATAPAAPPAAGSAAPPPTPPTSGAAPVVVRTLRRSGLLPDLTLDGGVRLWSSGAPKRDGFASVRAGFVWFREPTFISAGISAQIGVLHSTSLGFEAELRDLWRGVWVQAGAWPFDSTGGTSIEAAAGYAVFGVRYDRRLSGPRSGDAAVSLVLQLPLGTLWVALHPPKGIRIAR